MQEITRRGFIGAAGITAVSAGLALAGCNNGGEKKEETKKSEGGGDVKGKTVAFIPKVTGNAFFESANKGAQDKSKEWGFTVDYIGDATASVSAQVSVINQAVANGVDAISISTVDAKGVSDALKKATAAGIVVTTWDSDANPEDRTLMVSQGTPEILGQMLVDMGVSGLKERGKDPEKDEITYVWHYSQATVTDQNSWQVAAQKIIKEKYPKWKNVHENYYSNQDAEQAITIGEAILDAYPEIDLIICNDGTIYNWGLWDCAVQGAMGCYVAAFLAAGNEVKVGDTISIPSIGDVKVEANDSIAEGAKTGEKNNGVVLLPERLVFTKDNMNNYSF